jgi:exosortase
MAFGETTVSVFLLGCSMLTIMAGNADWVFGYPGFRSLGFSIGFLVFALPLPETLYQPVVSGLQKSVAAVTVDLLKLIGIPAHQSGTVIQLSHAVVGIDEACSGIRSLQSTLMATFFIGHLTLRRTGSKTILLLAGVLLAILGNVGRSFFLSYTAQTRGIESLKGMHDAAGWSILAFTATSVACSARLLCLLERSTISANRRVSLKRTPPASGSSPNPGTSGSVG